MCVRRCGYGRRGRVVGKKARKRKAGARSAGAQSRRVRAARSAGTGSGAWSPAGAGTVPAGRVAVLPKGRGAGRAAPAGLDPARLEVDEQQYRPRGCASGALGELPPQGLAVTYTFDAPAGEAPYPVAIRFTGVRLDPGDGTGSDARGRFERVERVDRLPAGAGRVAVTARVQPLAAGEWRVAAAPVDALGTPAAVLRLPRRVIATRTWTARLAFGPGVRLVAWPVLVGLGAVVALVAQAWLVARAGVDVAVVLALSLAGCGLGFVGGKVWYLVLHRKHPRTFLASGACIQGFLLVALGVVSLGAVLLALPVGVILDASVPGVLLGMAVGRPGCFLTGCCTGRPTGSRWGLWSSDRRLAVRRFPVQLVEAAAALLLGTAALLLVLAVPPPVPGGWFAAGLAAYTLCRQLLFPLRVESRTSTGRAVTILACGLLLVLVVAAVLAT